MNAATAAATAAIALDVMQRWPSFFLTMPAGVLMFEHVGQRLRDGDPVAAEIVRYLHDAGAVPQGVRR